MKQCDDRICPTGGFKSQEDCDFWCDPNDTDLYSKECGSGHLDMSDYDNRKKYPCDYGDCPYNAQGGYDCYNYCGLGADE